MKTGLTVYRMASNGMSRVTMINLAGWDRMALILKGLKQQ